MRILAACQTPRWLREPLLFGLLVGVHLVPIWAWTFFPSQDGPAHLATASLLLRYDDPSSAIVRAFYEINLYPVPTWFIHLLLAGLLTLASPLVAEKLLLSLLVIALPLSARYAFSAVARDRGPLAVVVLPLIYSYPLHMGFYSFVLSIPVFLVVLGFWLRRRGQWRPRSVVVLALLLLLLYFCHVVTLGVAGLTIGLLLAGELPALPWSLSGLRERVSAMRGDLIALTAAAVPALALAGAFWARFGGGSHWESSAADRLTALLCGSALVSFTSWELLVTVPLLVFFIGGVVAGRVTHRTPPGAPAAPAALGTTVFATLALALAAPDLTAGGAFLFDRLALLFLLLLAFWVAARAGSPGWRKALRIVPVVLSLAMLLIHARSYAWINVELDEYVAAGQTVGPGSTLLPVSFAHHGCNATSLRVMPAIHAEGHVVAGSSVVGLSHYQGIPSLFAVRYRAGVNPFALLAPREKLLGEPPAVDIGAYERRTGKTVDHVLVFCPGRLPRGDPRSRAIYRQLEAGYERVYGSPRGLAECYRRRSPARTRCVRQRF